MALRRLAVAVALEAGLAFGAPGVSTVHADHCATLLTSLTGPAIGGRVPSGRAEWKGNLICSAAFELEVEVRDVNLPNGTLVRFDG